MAKKEYKSMLLKYPFIRPLNFILKYFLKQKGLNQTYSGGISSFLLFNLIFSYVQMTIKDKGEDAKQLTLGDLLIGFFDYYGYSFNYELLGISVKSGGYYYKKEHRDWFKNNLG